MATFFVRNMTHPIASADGAGTLVSSTIDSVVGAVQAYALIPGASVSPGDVIRVIPTTTPIHVVAVATFVYNNTPQPTLPPVGT
jgi:hypothetical protein